MSVFSSISTLFPTSSFKVSGVRVRPLVHFTGFRTGQNAEDKFQPSPHRVTALSIILEKPTALAVCRPVRLLCCTLTFRLCGIIMVSVLLSLHSITLSIESSRIALFPQDCFGYSLY